MHILLLFAAKYLILIIALLAAGYWLTVPRQEKVRLAVFGIITAVVTFILAKVGAHIFYDPRPFVTHAVTALYPHSADNGFPSDHTLASAFIAFTIFSSSRRWGITLLVLAFLVGLSRVIGHIHSPIDIIGSFIFALAGYFTATAVTPLVVRKLTGKHEHLSS